MNDELGNAKCVVVVAKGFAGGLELGEGEDLVRAHKQLEKKSLKGLSHEIRDWITQMNLILKVYKIKSVLSLYAQLVFKFLGCLIEENIKCKDSETCTKSRVHISLQLPFSAIGRIFSSDHLALDGGNIYTCHGRFTEQFS
jgi:hypothetical protein